MTQVVVVSNARLPLWKGQQSLLVAAPQGRFFVLNTVTSPWREGPESLVYVTDKNGTWTPSLPVAGGMMDPVDAVVDLTNRLRQGTLLSQSEAEELIEQLVNDEIDGFGRYITPTR